MSPLLHPEAQVKAVARALKALKGTPYARMTLAQLEALEREFVPLLKAAAAGDPAPILGAIPGIVAARRAAGVRMVDLYRANKAVIEGFPIGGWTPPELARLRETHLRIEELMLEEFQSVLEHSLSTDYLTNLANRRALMTRLEQELRRSRRDKGEFALTLIDVDDLKPINDGLGHAAGDAVLQALAATLREQCREGVDLPARIGGDEFACILIGATEAGAATAVARIAGAFARSVTFPDGSGPSISWGVTTWRKGDSAASLMRRADRNLYRMKRTRP